MIGLLKGYVTHKFDNNIILDVNGVGYEVFLPSTQLMNLPISIANLHTPVTLHIHTQVKEDSFELFGFTTLKDKQFFKILISISGVGPKLGLTILNTMEVSSLMDAIRMGNSKILTKIPGIGTKTAERLVLELKNKQSLKKLALENKGSEPTQAPTSTVKNENREKPNTTQTIESQTGAEYFDDAINALISLGYRDSDALGAVRTAISFESSSLQGVIKSALKELS